MKLIIESPILQEVKIEKITPKKAVWRQVMQAADEVNQNHRKYPKVVINEAMSDCKNRIRRRSFWGELDHPSLEGVNENIDIQRQSTVLLKEVSHLIRDYEWRGNILYGQLETMDTPNGSILLNLLRDNCVVGLSLRGMASLKRMNGYNEVEGPMTIITYDSVSNPSHVGAVVDFNEMVFENKQKNKKIIYENQVQEKSCGKLICVEGICYLAEYFDKLIDMKKIEFYKRWI